MTQWAGGAALTVGLAAAGCAPPHPDESPGSRVEFDTEVSSFDPFLIDQPHVLGLDWPAGYEIRVDPASGIGLAFVVDVELGLWPTYEGTCLEVDDRATQYTMDLQPLGDIKYTYGVELVGPLGRDRLGEIGVDIELVELGERVDLGTYSVHDGEPIEDITLCES